MCILNTVDAVCILNRNFDALANHPSAVSGFHSIFNALFMLFSAVIVSDKNYYYVMSLHHFVIFPMMYYVLLSKIYNLHKKVHDDHIQNLSFSSIVHTNITKNHCFIKNDAVRFFLIDSVGYTNELKHSCQTR